MKKITLLAATLLGISFAAPPLAVKANMPDSATGAKKIEALCSLFNAYYTCSPQISDDRLIVNFSSELVVLTRDEIDAVRIYDSRTRQLIRFFKKTGDVDFAISFLDGRKKRTGFVRFKNNSSAKEFHEWIKEFVPEKLVAR